VYDGELKHNFNSVDFDGSTYFFRNNWWLNHLLMNSVNCVSI
jgi:hypothetical protein